MIHRARFEIIRFLGVTPDSYAPSKIQGHTGAIPFWLKRSGIRVRSSRRVSPLAPHTLLAWQEIHPLE